MTRDEWQAVLETEPATANQVGAIRGQFERLGFTDTDRAERLAICAALLGREDLNSTADLTMGEAGKLYRVLLGFRNRDELPRVIPATIADEHQADDDRITLPEAILQIVAMIYTACRGEDSADKSH